VEVRRREQTRKPHFSGCLDETRDVRQRPTPFGHVANEVAVGGELAKPDQVEPIGR
jgi:hypothetical protein